MNKNMIPLPSQTKKPTPSNPRTSDTKFLHQFIGDFLRMLYLHEHTHTLVEFSNAMDEVFKQMYKEFDVKLEFSYDQWVSRKNQWDKDFDIKDGGPSKEVCDGLFQYQTYLQCNEGKIKPIPRHPGYWLRSAHDSNPIVENQPLPLGTQQNDKHLKGHGPVHHQAEYPWISGGNLSNAPQNAIVQPPVSTRSFTQGHFGTHGDLPISPPQLRTVGTNEWNAGESTLPLGLPLYTHPSVPVQPTSLVHTSFGGPSGTNTTISSDYPSNRASAARARDNPYPQGQPRT